MLKDLENMEVFFKLLR